MVCTRHLPSRVQFMMEMSQMSKVLTFQLRLSPTVPDCPRPSPTVPDCPRLSNISNISSMFLTAGQSTAAVTTIPFFWLCEKGKIHCDPASWRLSSSNAQQLFQTAGDMAILSPNVSASGACAAMSGASTPRALGRRRRASHRIGKQAPQSPGARGGQPLNSADTREGEGLLGGRATGNKSMAMTAMTITMTTTTSATAAAATTRGESRNVHRLRSAPMTP